jgi:GDPmannose 4,6-dehydratase
MFGDNPEAPQSEKTALQPASPYACAKVFSHNLCRNYRESYGMHISSGILFNHESPRRGETFVTRKITLAAARIKLGLQEKLYLGNLDAKRDWGFAGDYVEAMWMMLQQETPDDYVIATGETYTVKQFLHKVFEIADLDVKKHVEIDERLFRPHEVPLLLGDATKAREKLGWTAKVGLDDLAKMMYESDLSALKIGSKE